MILEYTQRGFPYIDFKDHYGLGCSLQDSSLATEPCIWLGVDIHDRHSRMHLTIEMVKELLPFLQNFVDTGSIAG